MKNKVLPFLLAIFLMNDAVAQLESTRMSNVFTLDTKGGKLAIANDSTQLIFREGSLQILNNYKVVAEIFDNSIKDFTGIANKGGAEKGIFLVTPSLYTFKDNSLNFLSRVDFENMKLIPVSMSVEPKLQGKFEKFAIANHCYDKILNDIYFHDILMGTIIRYDIDENQFSVVPFNMFETYNLYYADSGYVYIIKYAYENPKVLLESFNYTNPDERTVYPEINMGTPRSFVFSDDRKKMYVTQNAVTYLINGNTLQKMPGSFVINTNKEWIGGKNLEKGLVEISNNMGDKIDELQLQYEGVQGIPMQSKTIVTYNSNRTISKPVTATSASASSKSATNKFPYSANFFIGLLERYRTGRDELYTKYKNYNDCMETGYADGCKYNLGFDSKGKAEKLLEECKEFQGLLSNFKSDFLTHVTSDYSTTKEGFDFDESTFKDIIEVSR